MRVIFIPSARQRSLAGQHELSLEQRAFLAAVEGVLHHPPETWQRYADTAADAAGVVRMEYDEFKAAATEHDQKTEAIHLAAACCHFWECLHD